MQIEEQQTITIRFWTDERNGIKNLDLNIADKEYRKYLVIRKHHKHLMLKGHEHAQAMIGQGYREGRFCELISDDDYDYEIDGWWKVKTVNF